MRNDSPAAKTKTKPGARLSIGGPMAEKDSLLDSAFLDNGAYSAILDPDDHRWFIVGRTGSGKSAVLRHLETEHDARVTRIRPGELAFQHITNLQAVRALLSLDVRLEPFFHALWRHLLLCQVVRHRYQNPSDQVKKNLFDRLRGRLTRSPSTAKRLEYVDELEANFWSTMEEQVKSHVNSLVTKLGGEASLSLPSDPAGSLASADVKLHAEREHTIETRSELRERFQKVVNDETVLKLNSVVAALAEETLESKQHFTYVVIDDLDLTWIEDDLANLLIKCLLQVALEMQQAKHLKILVALRTNIFDQLRVGDQARGGQEEKLRATAMILRWSKTELRDLVDLRLAAESAKLLISPSLSLEKVLPGHAQRGISAWAYVLNRTLMRPRDVILYLNLCLDECALGKPRITWDILKEVEPRYSRDRLAALRDEWNDPYFDISRVLDKFRGMPWSFDVGTLGRICEEIALLLVEGDAAGHGRADCFAGSRWLTPLCEPMWSPGAYKTSWRTQYAELRRMLFDIGFLGCARHLRQDPVYAHDSSNTLDDVIWDVTEEAEFSVHLAFRTALSMVPPGAARP